MRRFRTFAAGLFCAFWPLFVYPAAIEPSAFRTAATFSVDGAEANLTTGVAVMEARPNAPGYSWLRINFYSFPVTPAEIPGVMNGTIESLERKWTAKASNPNDYNRSHAVLQLSVDKNFKVWQVDMSVPGHTCTIAPFEPDVRKFLQEYQFDGKELQLRSKGSYVCDMKFMGIANQTFRWDVNLDLPVFEKRNLKP